MKYEALTNEALQLGIDIYEMPMRPRTKGLYMDGVIWINKYIPTAVEKSCILAEELGHFHTSVGNILDQTNIRNRKQEHRANQWAFHRLLPLSEFVQAYKAGVKNRHEMAEYLEVTEKFLQATIDRYTERYGLFTIHESRYVIYFDPLGIAEMYLPE